MYQLAEDTPSNKGGAWLLSVVTLLNTHSSPRWGRVSNAVWFYHRMAKSSRSSGTGRGLLSLANIFLWFIANA